MKKIVYDHVSGEVKLAVKSNSDDFASGFVQATNKIVEVVDTQTVNDVVVDTVTRELKHKVKSEGGPVTAPIIPEVKFTRIHYTEIDSLINSIVSIDDVKIVLRRILEQVVDKPDAGGSFKRNNL